MSHSKWSDIRRRKGAPDRPGLDQEISSAGERLRDALGIPQDLTIDYSLQRITDDDIPTIQAHADLLSKSLLEKGRPDASDEAFGAYVKSTAAAYAAAVESDPVVVTVVVNDDSDDAEAERG